MNKFVHGQEVVYRGLDYLFVAVLPKKEHMAMIYNPTYKAPKMVLVEHLSKPMSIEERKGKALWELHEAVLSHFGSETYDCIPCESWEKTHDIDKQFWIAMAKKVEIK